MLKDPRTEVNTPCDTGWTPLSSAIKTKDFELVRMLVTQGRNIDLGAEGSGKASPLHIAVMYGQYDTVELLLDHGANPNLEDHRGDSPFVLAVNGGREKIVRLFLSRGCIDLEKLDNSKMSVRLFKERYIDGIVRTLDQILGLA
ncbi:ankyrin repeat-containing domain protein [Tuber brumale]|nr:ankyrin repeat-containing domain protein [Tuber brumale]